MSLDEFKIIETYFKKPFLHAQKDVILGIGDDAACVCIPAQERLVAALDTLVAEVHFPIEWDAYDIAWRAVMVNISDMAAMAALPKWALLGLTLPHSDSQWLERFAKGLQDALQSFQTVLIGGDTTRGPLTITLTIQGLTVQQNLIQRSGAKPGDIIFVTGALGAAALAYQSWPKWQHFLPEEQAQLLNKFQRPIPRIDLGDILRQYATSAIDISDGLSADLFHICEASQVGACLEWSDIPVHPLVQKYKKDTAIAFAISGGDEYELCFTVNPKDLPAFYQTLQSSHKICHAIGFIEADPGLRYRHNHILYPLQPEGYQHFK